MFWNVGRTDFNLCFAALGKRIRERRIMGEKMRCISR